MVSVLGYCKLDSRGLCLNGNMVMENSGAPIDFFNSVYAHLQLQYPKYHKMDMLSKTGFLAAEALMQSMPGIKEKHAAFRSSVLLANHWASLHTDQLYWQSVQHIPSPSLFVCTLPNVVNAEICIRHKFKGENHFFIDTCFDASQMVTYTGMLFRNGRSSFSLCGWVNFFEDQYDCTIFAVEDSDSGTMAFTPEKLEEVAGCKF